ncbi:nucleotidyltransferase [Microbacterium sp. OR16]|uniref:nucleotidyltransferase n=1 Tax=Microbacterium sp. OR16 TaxID=3095345 RepID=UPI0039B4178E
MGVYPTIEKVVQDARQRIQVTDEELDEARERRAAIAGALLAEFSGARTYFNGSIAHGDALTPLTDVDLGVVIPNPDGRYGPGRKGPLELQERAAEAIRDRLSDSYEGLRIEFRDRKRSILVRFRDPIRTGLPDFTADVITAIDNPRDAGLFIPNYSSWDRSHPEEHTRLISEANKQTEATFARTVRLLKHWNRKNGAPLCTWNIKALALGCVRTESPLISSMRSWFEHSIAELKLGETEDPAGVSDKPIRLNAPRTEVVQRLEKAAEKLEKAVAYDLAGYPLLAQKELADLFNDSEMLAPPSRDELLREGARFHANPSGKPSSRFGSPALVAATASAAATLATTAAATPVRSWGDR